MGKQDVSDEPGPFFGVDRSAEITTLKGLPPDAVRITHASLEAIVRRVEHAPGGWIYFIHPSEWKRLREAGAIGPNGEIL